MYNKIFTLAGGHSTGTYYVELLSRTSGQMWDKVANTLVTSPDWATRIALTATEINGSGHFGWTLPSALPAGFYRASLRLQVGLDPAATDDVKDVCDFQYCSGDPVL